MNSYTKILSIAGSDSSGGAGIQADIKTCTALGCYAATAITAVTVQNTLGVTDVQIIDPKIVTGQIEAVLEDIQIDAIKFGMLASAEIITACFEVLKKYPGIPIVLDTVLISKSGHRLLNPEAEESLIDLLGNIATVLTPNLDEIAALLNISIPTDEPGMVSAARTLQSKLNCNPWILLKGGHLNSKYSNDCLISPSGDSQWYKSTRINTKNTHGTGCTLSAAIACGLGKKMTVPNAVKYAKDFITNAITAGQDLNIGKGFGPVDHLWKQEKR